ncbi:hypothetical protein KAM429_36330 [Aquipseudomonas alcaligenes]|nr:hypothetical protein KAM428_35740 [Pseudomonas alcaligenes]GIZ72872.1 hypothetical protein KAM429_36330 [Pseudomonas alcaligenes]
MTNLAAPGILPLLHVFIDGQQAFRFGALGRILGTFVHEQHLAAIGWDFDQRRRHWFAGGAVYEWALYQKPTRA